MRKLILSAFLLASGTALFAQTLEDVQSDIKKKNYEAARTKIDKVLTEPKAQANSEAWHTKAQVYGTLAKQTGDSVLLAGSLEAITKYFELESKVKDESRRMVRSLLENHATAFDTYSNYFNTGVKNFQDKKWTTAYYNFVGALSALDLLNQYKLVNLAMDTTVTLYAGYSAHNAQMLEEAAKYYGKIADAKIKDTNYIAVYEFLITYYQQRKDEANFNKYLTMGKELFPTEGNWVAYEYSAIEGAGATKLQKVADLLAKNPDNANLRIDYAVELFNYTYGKDRPTDYEARKEELNTVLKAAIDGGVTPHFANFIMSQHISNQIYDLQQKYNAIKGTKPEDVKKKQELNKQILSTYENLSGYSLKALELYEKMESPKPIDKANMKMLINQLIDYYDIKKQQDKVKVYEDKLKKL